MLGIILKYQFEMKYIIRTVTLSLKGSIKNCFVEAMKVIVEIFASSSATKTLTLNKLVVLLLL